jgi:AbiTii
MGPTCGFGQLRYYAKSFLVIAMPTIIEQIQLDALSKSVSVSDLLRRVKLAAVKLGLGQIEDWVERELNGYKTEVPDYRVVHGVPMAKHPYRGWEQIGGEVEGISTRQVGQSIASIEALIAGSGGENARITFPYSDGLVAKLNETNGTRGWPATLFVDKSALVAILDRVRNLALDWALAMEKAGIKGSEFAFTPEDKQKAHSTNINIGTIGTFSGNLGVANTSGDVVVQSFDISLLKDFVTKLSGHLEQLDDAGIDTATISKRLDELSSQMKGTQPKASVIRGLLVDIRNALAGAAGNLIPMGAIAQINNFLNGSLGAM